MKRVHTHSLLYAAAFIPKLIAAFFALLFFAACVLNSTKANGQTTESTGEIKGKITDEKGEGLIGATVNILDPKGKSSGRGTTTDFDGNYVLGSLQPGKYDLKFSYVSYISAIKKGIVVSGDKATVLNIQLKPDNKQMNEVVVLCYKKPMIDAGDTKIEQSISQENISNSGSLSIENVASQTAGVTQTDIGGSVTINSSRMDEVQYVVSGHRIMSQQGDYVIEQPDMAPMPQSTTVVVPQPKPDPTSTAEYKKITENEFKGAAGEPLSTFSIDVDAASYSIMRRMVLAGQVPPAEALRAEEMINYFPYQYPSPEGKTPFGINTELAECPWNSSHQLLKIGIQGKKVDEENMPPANLVYLVDVSGSMWSQERLPLVQYALGLLTDHMRAQDRISLVVYAGNAGMVLPSTSGSEKEKIKDAINNLVAGGSTAGGAGIKLAYKVAQDNFIKGGNNRIILCTDGDFNVGISRDEDLVSMIEEERKSGVFLSAIGVGTDNYKDAKMEQLADKGNGNYSYLDNKSEAKKIMVTQMGGTILTIAKDVKIQAVFNPAIVKSYRLIGYEDRKLENKDFKNDKIDAGEIGAGACVTALYEIVLGDGRDASDVALGDDEKMHLSAGDMMAVRIRYKAPDGDKSTLIEQPVGLASVPVSKASEDFRFASAVAAYTMLLRGSQYKGDFTYDKVLAQAGGALGKDENGYRNEFIELVKAASKLSPAVAVK